MILQKIQLEDGSYGPDPDLVPEGASVTYIPEIDAYIATKINEDKERMAELEAKIEAFTEAIAGGKTPKQAVDQFKAPPVKEWKPDSEIRLTTGRRIVYEGKEYRVNQGHNIMPEFPPGTAEALYTLIPQPDPGEDYPAWKQPTGAHDAYRKGDTVIFESEHGRIWESKINANTAVPDGDVPHNRYWEPIE